MHDEITFNHIPSLGSECGPKLEMISNFPAYTPHRVYLVPLENMHEIFDEYCFDFGVAGDIDVKVCLYEMTGRINQAGVTALKVANSEITVNNIVAAFQTITLTAPVSTRVKSYWIGFVFDDNTGVSTLSGNNCSRVGGYLTGRWCYYDPGSFTLPASINGNQLGYVAAAGEYPLYGSIRWTGDQLHV